jgi:hypothetical protein
MVCSRGGAEARRVEVRRVEARRVEAGCSTLSHTPSVIPTKVGTHGPGTAAVVPDIGPVETMGPGVRRDDGGWWAAGGGWRAVGGGRRVAGGGWWVVGGGWWVVGSG